jgi:hypothetical protein
MRIVGMTSAGSARLAANWLESIRRLAIDDIVDLYCLDEGSIESLSAWVAQTDNAATIRSFILPAQLPERPVNLGVPIDYGTWQFAELTLTKLSMLRSEPGDPEYLYTDVDAVFLDSPVEHLAALVGPRPYFQSDAPDFEQPSAAKRQLCMGCVWCPLGSLSRCNELWSRAYQWLKQRATAKRCDGSDRYFSDQEAVNAEYLGGELPNILPPRTWLNGARVRRNELPPEAIFYHANWVVGVRAKEARLRTLGVWFARDEILRRLGI